MFNILCPTDFSDVATNAVLYASEVAKRLHGRLHLTHVLYPTYVAVDSNGLFLADVGLEELKESSDERLDLLARELRTHDLTVTTSTEYGFWDTVLADLQEKINPDLIVSGTKGAGSLFSAKMLGMNTLDIVKQMDCPVLAVPPDYKFSRLETIVYATDYQFEDIVHAQFVVKLAELNSAKLNFVHVSSDDAKLHDDQELMDWFKEMVTDRVEYKKIDFKILVDRNIDEALELYATGENSDLLCLAMRNKSVLAQLFTHSHTYQLIADAIVPVLVFHLHENTKM